MTIPDMNPLGYTGLKQRTPANVKHYTRDPTVNDWQGFDVGDLWVNTTTLSSFQLASKAKNPAPPHNTVATWIPIGGGGTQVTSLTPDAGGAIFPVGGNINVNGVTSIHTDNVLGALVISLTGNASFEWLSAIGGAQSLSPNSGWWSNNGAGLVTFALPAVCPIDSIIKIAGFSAGGWILTQNALQVIHFTAAISTTPGVGGGLASTDQYDTIELLCTVPDVEFVCLNIRGNITII